MSLSLDALADNAEFDVIVTGAGMVGASAALGLSQLNLKVLLLDAFSFPDASPDYTPSYDARSTALSWGTRDILSRLKVWPDIAKHACPITNIHVSEKGRFGTTRMRAEEYQQEALGYVVPNQWLGRCLLKQLEQTDVTFCTPVKISDIQTVGERQRIHLNSAEVKSKIVTARLLIIADGTHSETGKLMGIESTSEPYSQHALIAYVSTELANDGVAYERFTSKGPLALLPLSAHQIALVWTHDETDIQKYLNMSDEDFSRELEAAIGGRLGRIEKCGQRNSYPLKLVKAKEQCRAGVLLLGNAAHSLHPVAGQGFNLAIRGVAASLEMIKNAQESGSAYESLSALNQLCASRTDDQLKTILLSDQLVKLFGSASPFLGLGRDLGLIGLDNSALLKSIFAERAMGLSDRKAIFG